MFQKLLSRSQLYLTFFGPRAPEPGTIFLRQNRVYILPTRPGLAFSLALVVMLIGSINYNLSLGYILTFLLASMGLVAILHTFRNLVHLHISSGRVEPVFADETAWFELFIENRSRIDLRTRRLRLCFIVNFLVNKWPEQPAATSLGSERRSVTNRQRRFVLPQKLRIDANGNEPLQRRAEESMRRKPLASHQRETASLMPHEIEQHGHLRRAQPATARINVAENHYVVSIQLFRRFRESSNRISALLHELIVRVDQQRAQ